MTLGLEELGFAAGTLTTLCWLPQALKIIASRDTRAISFTTQAAFTLGCSLWAAYGVFAGSPSITLFNVVTAFLSGSITLMKLQFG